MIKNLLKGFQIGIGFILAIGLLFGIVYAVGFHTANEILGGTFSGNYSFMNGNVGIGTSDPQSVLDVNGSINISSGNLYFSDGTNQSSTGKNKIIQIVGVNNDTVSTTTSNIPYNSLPTNTNGKEFITATITPTSSSNKLKIDLIGYVGSSGGADSIAAITLFKDNDLNPIRSASGSSSQIDQIPETMVITYWMDAGTTSPITFKGRYGISSGTGSINGAGGLGKYGGTLISSITITEIEN